jgi:hypothetical protein
VVYGQQNLWLQSVQTVTVSNFRNIDKPLWNRSGKTVLISRIHAWATQPRSSNSYWRGQWW